jgi:hypothetical protein
VEAKQTRPNQDATIGRFDQVVLRLNTHYMQRTNTVLGISFGGNYQVLVVDCDGTELHNITSNVAINEFIDANGLNQIEFEIVPNVDYWAMPVFLKFIHTVSGLFWYSNPILMTDYDLFYTTLFDYKPKATDAKFKSIELQCKRESNSISSTSKEQTEEDGTLKTSRVIPTEYENYLFENMDNFTYRRMNLDLLTAQVIFINGYRMTNKITFESKPKKGTTNTFDPIEFKPAIKYKERLNRTFQIFQELQLVGKSPNSTYTLATIPSEIVGTFNKTITLGTGFLKVYKDNVLFLTFTEADIVVVGNVFTIDVASLFIANGEYYINFTSGLFSDGISGDYVGISNNTDWDFEIENGEFDGTEFDNDEFLTT